MTTDQLQSLQTADRARRMAALSQHVDTLDAAKLIDMTAVSAAILSSSGRGTGRGPIVHAAAAPPVKATSLADFLDKYQHVGAGGTVDVTGVTLNFGTAQLEGFPGVNVIGGTLNFTRPKGSANAPEKNCFGIIVPAGQTCGFSLGTYRSNNGLVWNESGTNLTFTGNDVQWGTDGSYYSRLAVWAGAGINIDLSANYFHDSQNCDRVCELWGATGRYFENKLFKVNDGGHFMEPGSGLYIASNVGRYIHRMGTAEVQNVSWPPAGTSRGIIIENNVAYDFWQPYYDTFGLSAPVSSTGLIIRTNYYRLNSVDGTYGTEGGQNRAGYCIEGPQPDPDKGMTASITGNVLGGDRVAMYISCPAPNTPCTNNQIYGPPALWSDIGGEPGALGTGGTVGANPARSTAAMPAPPADPTNIPPTNPENPTVKPTFTATGVSSTEIDLNITAGVAPFKIAMKSKNGTDALTVFKQGAAIGACKVIGLQPQWQYNFVVTGADGAVSDTIVGQCLATDPTSPPDTSAAQIADLTAKLAAANSKLAQIAAIATARTVGQ